MAGAAARLRAEGERDLALAHTTAMLTRVERLRPLGHYLRRDRPAARGGSMLDRFKAIARATGGEVRA